MRITITQPNYIPWKGYFDLIALSDTFVVLDDVQYTSRDWRNRNTIKTPNGLSWLTIPVDNTNGSRQNINMIYTKNTNWYKNHIEQINRSYKKSEYFDEIYPLLEETYRSINTHSLLKINLLFIKKICNYLDIKCKLKFSSSLNLCSVEKSDKILEICKTLEADHYITGIKSKNYLNENKFKENNINVYYEDYKNYPEYTQLWGAFNHKVSVVDLLFNCGPSSYKFLKYGSNSI